MEGSACHLYHAAERRQPKMTTTVVFWTKGGACLYDGRPTMLACKFSCTTKTSSFTEELLDARGGLCWLFLQKLLLIIITCNVIMALKVSQSRSPTSCARGPSYSRVLSPHLCMHAYGRTPPQSVRSPLGRAEGATLQCRRSCRFPSFCTRVSIFPP